MQATASECHDPAQYFERAAFTSSLGVSVSVNSLQLQWPLDHADVLLMQYIAGCTEAALASWRGSRLFG
jgi:hypothetical protein